jgi:hypothetical protein
MAYTGRENTGSRESHGWAIAGAFAGQAAIIIGIGTLLAGIGGAPTATQMSAVPAPALVAPQPGIASFPYQVAIDGQQGGAVFPTPLSSVPTFTVRPGQDLTVSLDVTLGPGQSASGMSADLVGASPGTGSPDVKTPYNDSVQLQSPGTHVFLLTWPKSASELRPGTQWTLYLSTGPGWAGAGAAGFEAPIAQITISS